MDSLKMREFSQAIINFTNQSKMPAEFKRLVFLDILRQLESSANNEINIQLAERNKSKEVGTTDE